MIFSFVSSVAQRRQRQYALMRTWCGGPAIFVLNEITPFWPFAPAQQRPITHLSRACGKSQMVGAHDTCRESTVRHSRIEPPRSSDFDAISQSQPRGASVGIDRRACRPRRGYEICHLIDCATRTSVCRPMHVTCQSRDTSGRASVASDRCRSGQAV